MIIRSKAPLRLGLAGGGTDISPYCDEHGGVVLNATIKMFAYCTIEPTDDGKIEFYAVDRKEAYSCNFRKHIDLKGELLLHKGVYNRVYREFLDGERLSFRMITYSDAPAGSGLGSSSTMVVAILKAFMEWKNLPLGEYDTALMAYEIEREEIGLSGGKQDQYAATFGGFNFMEFYENKRVIVNPLRIKRWIKNELESSLILYYTGNSRDSAKIIDEQMKSTNREEKKSIEAMEELKRMALKMKECLLKGDFEGVSESLRLGWEAKKNTASVISNPEIEEIYDFVMSNGGKSAKISGAGGGGFMMILCDPTKKFELMEKLKKKKGKIVLTSFVETGTQAWTIYK